MTASPNDSNKPTKPTFWITTNSPGELSSWVAPITQLIMKKNPDSIIRIALVPCQYASGSELDVAMGIEGVYSVTSPKETISQLLSRPWIQRHPNTCVIYLGGDPLYAKLLGLKMRCPVIAYTEHNRSLGIGITQTFYKSTDGDLMAAKFALMPQSQAPAQYDCTFFSGSRPRHFHAFAPICLEVATELIRQNPTLKIAIQKSPFIKDADWNHILGGISHSGIHLLTGNSSVALTRSRLIVSLPGTTTAEAMYARTPMLTILPLHRPDLIQFDGLLGILGNLPGIGTALKRLAIWIARKNTKFVALPNRIAQRAIVPEIIGQITIPQITDAIQTVLADTEKLTDIKRQLAEFPATDETANKIVEAAFKRLIPAK